VVGVLSASILAARAASVSSLDTDPCTQPSTLASVRLSYEINPPADASGVKPQVPYDDALWSPSTALQRQCAIVTPPSARLRSTVGIVQVYVVAIMFILMGLFVHPLQSRKQT